MTTPPSDQTPDPLMLRRPGVAFGVAGLAVVYAVGLAFVTAVLVATQGYDWSVAQAFIPAAAAATALTAVELGPALRRAQVQTWRRVVVGGARAWGAVGGAWPLVWAVFGAAEGLVGNLWFELVRVIAGAVIGAAAGAAAAWLAGRLALTRR